MAQYHTKDTRFSYPSAKMWLKYADRAVLLLFSFLFILLLLFVVVVVVVV